MLEKIAKILRDYKSNQELVVTELTSFEELEFDSLDIVELVMKLEEDFSVTIEIGEDLKTIGKLMETIEAAKSR